jgi:hypothetical protein
VRGAGEQVIIADIPEQRTGVGVDATNSSDPARVPDGPTDSTEMCRRK